MKDKLAWNVHNSAGRAVNRRYKPLKVIHVTDISVHSGYACYCFLHQFYLLLCARLKFSAS